jgi:hypothetical protein
VNFGATYRLDGFLQFLHGRAVAVAMVVAVVFDWR